jgi:hypothetical protein
MQGVIRQMVLPMLPAITDVLAFMSARMILGSGLSCSLTPEPGPGHRARTRTATPTAPSGAGVSRKDLATVQSWAPPKRAVDPELSMVFSADQNMMKIALIDASPHTLYFSDRPNRLAGHITMENYLKEWADAPTTSTMIRRTRRCRSMSPGKRREGQAWILPAHEAQFSLDDLDALDTRMKSLTDGWSWRTRVLDEQLVLHLNAADYNMGIGDEFHQYYTLEPSDG